MILDSGAAAVPVHTPFKPPRASEGAHATPQTDDVPTGALVPIPRATPPSTARDSVLGVYGVVPASPVACGQAVHALAALPSSVLGGSGMEPSLILAAGRDKTIRAYSQSGSLHLQHSAHVDRIWALAAVDESTIASASSDRTVRLWKLEAPPGAPMELRKLGTLASHSDAVQCLLMHQGCLVSGSADATIRVWDVQTRRVLTTCTRPAALRQYEHTAVHSLGHCAVNGRAPETLWSGHWGGSIHLWNAPEGVLLRSLEGVHEGPVWALQPLAHTSELMASGGADGAIRLWDARTPRPAGELHSGAPVYALAATHEANDSVLVSAGYDGALKVWDVRSMRAAPIANLRAHRAPVRSLLACDGGVWSGSTDGTVRCWDVNQLAPLISPGQENARQLEYFIATGAQPAGMPASFISP